MPARERTATSFRDEDLIDLFSRLPDLLERRPDLEPTIYRAFLKAFARREEVALVMTELRELRTEMNQRFEQVDQRFEQVDRRLEQFDRRMDEFQAEVADRFEQVDRRMDEFRAEVADRFGDVQRSIDRLGARWGIRNESLFRQTVAALLEQVLRGPRRAADHLRRAVRHSDLRRPARSGRDRRQRGAHHQDAPRTQAAPVRGVDRSQSDARHSGHGVDPQPPGARTADQRDRGDRARRDP